MDLTYILQMFNTKEYIMNDFMLISLRTSIKMNNFFERHKLAMLLQKVRNCIVLTLLQKLKL